MMCNSGKSWFQIESNSEPTMFNSIPIPILPPKYWFLQFQFHYPWKLFYSLAKKSVFCLSVPISTNWTVKTTLRKKWEPKWLSYECHLVVRNSALFGAPFWCHHLLQKIEQIFKITLQESHFCSLFFSVYMCWDREYSVFSHNLLPIDPWPAHVLAEKCWANQVCLKVSL